MRSFLICIFATFSIHAEYVTQRNMQIQDIISEQTTSTDAIGRYVLKRASLSDKHSIPFVLKEHVDKDNKLCNIEDGQIAPYLRKLQRGEYSSTLADASRDDNEGQREIALHFCRLKNGIPTIFPKKYQVIDSRSSHSRNKRFPSGYIVPKDGSYPESHLDIIDGHGFQSKNCKACHEKQFEEWSTSAHARAAVDVGFNLFEKTLREANQAAGHNGFGPHGDQEPTTQFCGRCHIGTGFDNREDLGPVSPTSTDFIASNLSEEESNGISCMTCHSKTGIDPKADEEKGILGDGLANVSHLNHYETHNFIGSVVYGPYSEDEINAPHASKKWNFEDSSQLCLGCHDVRFAKDDSRSGEKFQRLENLGTEHLEYKKKGGKHSCVDCHMTQDPNCEPGVMVQEPISSVSGNVRDRTNHAFLGVTVALQTHNGRFVDTDTEDRNNLGMPLGREQLRACLLERAVSVETKEKDQRVEVKPNGDNVLVVEPNFRNTGTGHGVPSGFSQEREVWVKISVKDDNGNEVYRSGYTWGEVQGEEREKWAKKLGFDSVEEFNKVVNNEDLAHEFVILDPVTLEAIHLKDKEREKIAKKYGYDDLDKFNEDLKAGVIRDKRGNPIGSTMTNETYINSLRRSPGYAREQMEKYGYASVEEFIESLRHAEHIVQTNSPFTVEVIYRTGKVQHGPDFPERGPASHSENENGLKIFTNQFIRERQDGGEEIVFSAHLADHMNNTESLKPFEPEKVKYEIPVDPDYEGEYHVDISLNYRPYPPHFFRALVEGEQLRAQREGRDPIAGQTEYHNAIKSITMNEQNFSVESPKLKAKTKKCYEDIDNLNIDSQDMLLSSHEIMDKSLRKVCKTSFKLPSSKKCIKEITQLVPQEKAGIDLAAKLIDTFCSDKYEEDVVLMCLTNVMKEKSITNETEIIDNCTNVNLAIFQNTDYFLNQIRQRDLEQECEGKE